MSEICLVKGRSAAAARAADVLSTADGFALGFPRAAHWREIFNSDYYGHFPNPRVRGNAGGVVADGPPRHGFGQSAHLTLPASGIPVFAGH
ncbi:alpha amylase C-terminal domain-containing protein [Couchioplanes caeruleus]|uniref:Alpha-amylase/branching enzyme C-terminal all beta domain-containing protein n=1 Tax=Couchioplanes caeruleus subsp. caeruleus TaxID=56427 RepID=A0A1K0FBE8_9ACTN|nr:alpha amylase C-terminal domain-containing protein [Couchioplanes caeruleus]OJF10161.1 hypothetical protein BG844_33575 [Couchioplanes caeruleus subsp. caeruleus]